MSPERCQGLTVLPQVNFSPLDYPNSGGLFTTVYVDEVMGRLNTSFGVHTWNTVTRDETLNLRIAQPFALLALTYCPKVHDTSDRLF
jgi:hypothetical protein